MVRGVTSRRVRRRTRTPRAWGILSPHRRVRVPIFSSVPILAQSLPRRAPSSGPSPESFSRRRLGARTDRGRLRAAGARRCRSPPAPRVRRPPWGRKPCRPVRPPAAGSALGTRKPGVSVGRDLGIDPRKPRLLFPGGAITPAICAPTRRARTRAGFRAAQSRDRRCARERCDRRGWRADRWAA